MNSDIVNGRGDVFKNDFVAEVPCAPKIRTGSRNGEIPMLATFPVFTENCRKILNEGTQISGVSP